ncbi:MAG: copper amine oxidase N-terminal domain-containing protein [Candidatus Ornithomonoglobus sp.]
MKKILCLLTVLSMSAVCGFNAMAANKDKGEPDVIVDGSKILFDDQNAKIIDDVTLVPARGVFEAMDCKVDWNAENRTVTVTSSTGVRYVVITIDSNVMQISTFKSLMDRDDKDYILEVPAKIINDRTMIPLRAVSEAFDCSVEWDSEAYAVNISKGAPILLEGFTYTAPAEEDMIKVSLSTDAEGGVGAGEEFTVYIDIKNSKSNSYLSCISAGLEFDKEKFEYVDGSGTMLNDNNEAYTAAIPVENLEYDKGAMIAFGEIDSSKARTIDGHVFCAKFRSLTGEAGTISRSNDYDQKTGYETYVIFTDIETEKPKDVIYDGQNIIVDKTPLVIGE